MKLLYVCADRASDPLHWSGTVFNCCNALRNAGAEIEVFDQIPFECPWGLRLLHQAYKRFTAKTHYLQVEPAILRKSARRIERQFATSGCDAVFCPGTGVPVYGYIDPTIPVFTYLDATKYTWIESYFGINSLTRRSLRQVRQLDQTALTNNVTTIFSSAWARDSAMDSNLVDLQRTEIVPFGANLFDPPTRDEIDSWVDERLQQPIRLLFLGKEWERKGGPDAISLTRAIIALGLEATLEIVGCAPALTDSELKFCNVHGFVDHSVEAGRAEFRETMRRATFLVFLSRAEAFGIALCEAAAFGLPAYASRVGGIPTVVRHLETGLLADAPFNAMESASTLSALFRDRVRYREMTRSARSDFETRLNWNAAGHELLQCVEHGLRLRR